MKLEIKEDDARMLMAFLDNVRMSHVEAAMKNRDNRGFTNSQICEMVTTVFTALSEEFVMDYDVSDGFPTYQ